MWEQLQSARGTETSSHPLLNRYFQQIASAALSSSTQSLWTFRPHGSLWKPVSYHWSETTGQECVFQLHCLQESSSNSRTSANGPTTSIAVGPRPGILPYWHRLCWALHHQRRSCKKTNLPQIISGSVRTKAVHLEVVKDLTTDSFVASLIRFVSRRSLPLNIHTSNLVGAKNELYDLYKFLQDKKNQNLIQSYLFSQKVTWHTIPERAPHFGGLWEAAVKAAKHHLKRVVSSQRLTYDELETVVCQAEACMNSRPLGSITSHSPDGLTPLTPGHFLTGRAMRAYPVPKVDFKPTPLQRWVHCQRMGQQFWKRWSQEYLQQLQKAVKWHKKQKNYQVGDIVMLTDGKVYQCQWTMAKVVAVYPGKDGVVRAVDVQVELAIKPTKCNSKAEYLTKLTTRTAIYRRPVHKLAMLLAADEVPEKAETLPEEPEEDP